MDIVYRCFIFFFFKQKTAYEMRISDWSSDVCSSDLASPGAEEPRRGRADVGDGRPPGLGRVAAEDPHAGRPGDERGAELRPEHAFARGGEHPGRAADGAGHPGDGGGRRTSRVHRLRQRHDVLQVVLQVDAIGPADTATVLHTPPPPRPNPLSLPERFRV